jgi:hypothetical protein
MKNLLHSLQLNLVKLPAVDIRLVLFVITLGMLIIGAGAPDTGGGIVK